MLTNDILAEKFKYGLFNFFFVLFSVALRPNAGHGLLIFEVS